LTVTSLKPPYDRRHTALGGTNPSGTEKQCRRQYFSHISIRLSKTACVNWRIDETPYSPGNIRKRILNDNVHWKNNYIRQKGIKNSLIAVQISPIW